MFSFFALLSNNDSLFDVFRKEKINITNVAEFDSSINAIFNKEPQSNIQKANFLLLESRIYSVQNQNAKALKNILFAIEILDTSSNIVSKTEALHRLANAHSKAGNFIEANQVYLKALNQSLSLDSNEYIYILINHAINKPEIGQIDSTAFYFNLIADYYKRREPKSKNYVDALNNLAILKDMQGDEVGVRSIYLRVIDYYSKSLDFQGLALTWSNLGGNYLDFKEYDSASYYLMKSYKLSDSLNFISEALEACNNLAYLSEKQLKYKEALKWTEVKHVLIDSLKSAEVLIEIGSLNKEYENRIIEDRNQRKLEKEKLKAERQANIQFFGIFLGILFFFLVVFMAAKFSLPEWLANGIVFFAFVLLFEFVLVVLDPFIDSVSDGKPLIKLVCNVLLALFIIPLHSLFEKRLRRYLTT